MHHFIGLSVLGLWDPWQQRRIPGWPWTARARAERAFQALPRHLRRDIGLEA